MSSQLQPSLAGLSGMARRLVSEGVLPEADVRKAMADSSQHKVTLSAWLLDQNLVESVQLTQIASADDDAEAALPLPLAPLALIASSSSTSA